LWPTRSPREKLPEIGAERKLKIISDQPYQHLEEIEQMARLLLMEAATTGGYQGYVRSAVEGAGKKQVILGGMEIVALAAISLGALHVILSKGKTSERTMKKNPRGKWEKGRRDYNECYIRYQQYPCFDT